MLSKDLISNPGFARAARADSGAPTYEVKSLVYKENRINLHISIIIEFDNEIPSYYLVLLLKHFAQGVFQAVDSVHIQTQHK